MQLNLFGSGISQSVNMELRKTDRITILPYLATRHVIRFIDGMDANAGVHRALVFPTHGELERLSAYAVLFSSGTLSPLAWRM